MKRNIFRSIILIILALSPLALRFVKHYLPAYTDTAAGYHLFFALPYILLIGSAFLGIRLNQTRIFFSMMLFVAIYYGLNQLESTYLSELNRSSLLGSLAVLAPACLILLFVIPEGALVGWVGLLRLLTITVIFLVCVQLSASVTPLVHNVLSARIIFTLDSWHLPDIVWLTTCGAFVYFLLPYFDEIAQYKTALMATMIALLICLNRTADNVSMTADLRIFQAACFSVIGTITLYAIYKLYWHKVYIDELTGVLNRRAFNERLTRLGRRFALAMVDIDHFKKFNDTYGHAEGDNVLRYVAAHIATNSNAEVYRYGGEEFALIYPGTEVKHIFWLLERTRETLETRDFFIRMQETLRMQRSAKDRGDRQKNIKKVQVTISIGVAQRNEKYRTPEDVITAADKALYSAKKKGRNCCVRKS